MSQNNAANVSTVRGLEGGYFFRAPIDVIDKPTAANFADWRPGTEWVNLGYVPEDGFTEGVEFDEGDAIVDINSDIIDQPTGTATETLTIGLMEINAAALSTQYGTDNVTDENGVITISHNWGEKPSYCFALLLLLKNGRRWVKFIDGAKVTALGEFTGNSTTAAQREITLTYQNRACTDFIESTETSTE